MDFDYRRTAWAIRPDLLPAIASAIAERIKRTAAAEANAIAIASEGAARDVETTGGVAVLPLHGMITPRSSFLSTLFGGGSLTGFRDSFREALKNDDVGSILIDVDSPGGSVALVPEVAAEIREARGIKPITAVANTDAGSAAYWIAAQADELVVTPSGEVGSIGVFALHMDESRLLDEMGVTPTFVSAGKFKTEGNPYEPLTDEAKAAIQEGVDTFYDLFVADVAAGRGIGADRVRAGFGEGRMVDAHRAVELGMADAVETYEQTVDRLVGTRSSPSPKASSPEPAELRALVLAQPRR